MRTGHPHVCAQTAGKQSSCRAGRCQQKRPEAARLLVAELTGEARHHAQWRDLTADEKAAVAALREFADGQADLLAEVAGILEARPRGSWRSS